MSRPVSPQYEKALKLWLKSGRTMKPAEIAEKVGVSPGMVRKWKSVNKWDDLPEPKVGAPRGNRNAKGNRGGKGGPPGNSNAVIHGLFRKFLPNDPETLEIFDATETLSPLDGLWMQIRIAWTSLLRSQKIMHVQDKDELIKEIKKEKQVFFGGEDGGLSNETEFEIQFAWDRQGRVLTAQSSAMANITRMIKQYEAMLRTLPPDEVLDEQRQRIVKLRAEVKAVTGDGVEPVQIIDDIGGEEV